MKNKKHKTLSDGCELTAVIGVKPQQFVSPRSGVSHDFQIPICDSNCEKKKLKWGGVGAGALPVHRFTAESDLLKRYHLYC